MNVAIMALLRIVAARPIMIISSLCLPDATDPLPFEILIETALQRGMNVTLGNACLHDSARMEWWHMDPPPLLPSSPPPSLINFFPPTNFNLLDKRLLTTSLAWRHALRHIPRTIEYPRHASLTRFLGGQVAMRKSPTHRGIERVNVSSLSDEFEATEPFLLQEAVPSLRVAGYAAFDLGFYVLVTSLSPLCMHVHREFLVRFPAQPCTEQEVDSSYPARRCLVIDDEYTPPWRALNGAFYTSGNGHGTALLAALAHAGHNTTRLVEAMQAALVDTLLPLLREEAMVRADTHDSSFSLFRVDVMIDESLKPWIIEINQSPNLSPSKNPELRGMFALLVRDLFDMVGVNAASPHVDNDRWQPLV